METLVVVAQHRNQYYGKVKHHGADRFGSSPSKSFREINCRTFQTDAGILPTPFKAYSTPVAKRASTSVTSSPKTVSPRSNFPSFDSPQPNDTVKSSPIPINIKVSKSERFFDEELYDENFSYSELWAGPAYSNSPPPSSLPIPKFSLQPKRTVSLNLPVSSCDIKLQLMAKSAPPSPTREHNASTRDLFRNADSATRTLRRILNLDITDE